MERTQDKPSTTQDLKQGGVKDKKHEGAHENRPERPLAAEGKGEHDKTDLDAKSSDDVAGEEQNATEQVKDEPVSIEKPDEAADEDEEKPSQGV